MMTPELQTLTRRAVACEGWRWMPGMRMLHPRMGPARVLRVTQQGVWVAKEESLASGFRVDEDGCLPDLSDPATLGCLPTLVEASWCMPVAIWYPKNKYRCSVSVGRLPVVTGRHWTEATKAETLVAALEAADSA